MKYMGSKARIAKYILPIILKDRKPNQLYVEPFCGGCNTLDKVDGYRIGNDIDEDLICLWNEVARGWTPPNEIDEYEYKNIKQSINKSPLKGYCKFALSYGGKAWGGWRRDSIGKRDYVEESYRNALEQFPKLIGVNFHCGDYRDFFIPENSIIYCDIPYHGTTGYSRGFNHNAFWEWCRIKANDGHAVFVSEYEAPSFCECVWKKEICSSLTKDTGSKKAVEKLFLVTADK